ncbi:MAG: D-amino acid aminotransferase [Gammaproteobacteria bacterium]|nr:D-amino acid aminotransferase [Gammaproteobacteria bacterium]
MTINTIYLNGKYMPIEQATISVMDRGFLFGDGIYEVIPVFGNKLLRLDEHLVRLQNSLNRISLLNPHTDNEWADIFSALLEKNNGEDRAIYLQISRGAYSKRDLSTNADFAPTIFVMVLQVTAPDIEIVSAGISVITVDDFRWNACDIKSTSLVASVMLRQQATDAGVEDAILIRNGIVTEGTASNVFLVKDNILLTPPTGLQLLPGITRDLVIEIANNNGIVVKEREIKEAELYNADEIWMTSSTREVAPVIKLNGKKVGAGVAGSQWKRMMDLYQRYKQQLRGNE